MQCGFPAPGRRSRVGTGSTALPAAAGWYVRADGRTGPSADGRWGRPDDRRAERSAWDGTASASDKPAHAAAVPVVGPGIPRPMHAWKNGRKNERTRPLPHCTGVLPDDAGPALRERIAERWRAEGPLEDVIDRLLDVQLTPCEWRSLLDISPDDESDSGDHGPNRTPGSLGMAGRDGT